MTEILNVEHIIQKYQADNGEIIAVDDISFSVGEGEIVSIVGPSGSGKSTVLSIIAGLLKPTYGRILVKENEVEGICSEIGYMLQKDYLLEWRNIYKNVILGLEIQKKRTPENLEYVDRLLRVYGLEEFKQKFPSQLSGGMRQRAALIRTLAVNPDVLLLDEAFSALDYQTRIVVTEDVYKILKNERKTTLMVTHDISEAISMSDRIIVFTERPSKIKAIYSIDFDMENRTPISSRNHPKFREYYNTIWKELDVHVT